MKSQRRHELQQNVLDSELGQIISFLKRRGTYITWGLLVVAVIVLLVVYVRNKQRKRHQETVTQYEQLKVGRNVKPDQRLAALKKLADKGDDPRIAALANLAQADEYARRYVLGGAKLSGRQQRDYARKADLLYRKVIHLKGMPWAVARGHLGFGKLSETRREFVAARSSYQAILAMGDEAGQMKDVAEKCLEDLPRLAGRVSMATTRPAPPAAEPAGEAAGEAGAEKAEDKEPKDKPDKPAEARPAK